MPPSWIAIALLTAALAVSGAFLKGQIQTNGELRQSLAEQNSAVERLNKQVEEQEAEKQRLSTILAERDKRIHEHSKQAAANKDAARVAVADSPDLRRCSDVYWPADVVQRLREGAGQGGGDDPGKATGTSALGLPAPPHQSPIKYRY